MTFPKEATLGGVPVRIVGPHIWVEDGKWHYSHKDVFVSMGGVTFLADIDVLEDVEITAEERAAIEDALESTFPEVVRLARAITGQG